MLIEAVPVHAVVKESAVIVMQLCGLESRSEWPNACNLNYYKSGSDCCGWHADDEPLMLVEDWFSLVISP